MKPITLNKDSWHYKLAAKLQMYNSWDTTTDLCSYTRTIFLAAVTVLGGAAVLLSVVGVGLLLVGDTLALWAAVATVGLNVAPSPLAFVGTIGAAGVIVYYTLNGMEKAYTQYTLKRNGKELDPYKSRSDGFIRKAYRSFKEKTCVKVVFVPTNDAGEER